MKAFQKLEDNFNLNSVEQIYFWKSEWESFDPGDKLCNVSVGYLIFRFLFMCYFITSTTISIACDKDFNFYFIFLTNLTFALQLVYSVFYFTRILWIWIQRRKVETRLFSSSAVTVVGFSQKPVLPWPEKIIWVLISMVSVVPYGVTLGYWIFLYDPDPGEKLTACEEATNYLVHAINAPMAFLDSTIMAAPIRITHMIFPIIVALAYCLFSGIYEVAGGTYSNGNYIYPILDWKNNPGWATLTSVGGIIFAAAAHLVCNWGVYRVRVFLANQYLCSRKEPLADRNRSVMAYTNPIPVDANEDGSKVTTRSPSGHDIIYPEPQTSKYQV